MFDTKKYYVVSYMPTPGRNGGGITQEHFMFTEDGAFELCAQFQQDYPDTSFGVVINKI